MPLGEMPSQCYKTQTLTYILSEGENTEHNVQWNQCPHCAQGICSNLAPERVKASGSDARKDLVLTQCV